MIVDEQTRTENPSNENIDGIVLVAGQDEKHPRQSSHPTEKMEEMIGTW